MRRPLRFAVTGILLLFAIPIVVAVIGEFFIELAREQGLYENPSRQWSAVMTALHGFVTQTWFLGATALLAGLTIGLWLDTVLRRREAKLARETRRACKEDRSGIQNTSEPPKPIFVGQLIKSLSRRIVEETQYIPDGDLPTGLMPLHSEAYAAMRMLNRLGISTNLAFGDLTMRQQLRLVGQYFSVIYPLLIHNDVDGARRVAHSTLELGGRQFKLGVVPEHQSPQGTG